MKRHRKHRKDARLKTLHPIAQKKLWEFLQLPGNGYAEAIPFCKTNFGFAPEESSLSGWYQWFPLGRELSEFQQLKAELKQELESNKELNLNPDDILQLTEAILARRAAKMEDPSLYIELRKLRQKDRDQDAVDRRLKLLEAREEKAKKILSNEKLSPAQREEKMRGVFGLAPKPAKA